MSFVYQLRDCCYLFHSYVSSVRIVQPAPFASVLRWQRWLQDTPEQISSPLLARVQQRPSSSSVKLRGDLFKLWPSIQSRNTDGIEEPGFIQDPVLPRNRRHHQGTGNLVDFVRRRAENAITGRAAANFARCHHHQLEDRANLVRLPRRWQLRLLNLHLSSLSEDDKSEIDGEQRLRLEQSIGSLPSSNGTAGANSRKNGRSSFLCSRKSF